MLLGDLQGTIQVTRAEPNARLRRAPGDHGDSQELETNLNEACTKENGLTSLI